MVSIHLKNISKNGNLAQVYIFLRSDRTFFGGFHESLSRVFCDLHLGDQLKSHWEEARACRFLLHFFVGTQHEVNDGKCM